MIQNVNLESSFNLFIMSDDDDKIKPVITSIKIYYNEKLYTAIYWDGEFIDEDLFEMEFFSKNLDKFKLRCNDEKYDIKVLDIEDKKLRDDIINNIKFTLLNYMI